MINYFFYRKLTTEYLKKFLDKNEAKEFIKKFKGDIPRARKEDEIFALKERTWEFKFFGYELDEAERDTLDTLRDLSLRDKTWRIFYLTYVVKLMEKGEK